MAVDAERHAISGQDASVAIVDSSGNVVRLTAQGSTLLTSVNGVTVESAGAAGTVTAAAGAATLAAYNGTVTSEALTTAAAADYVLTLTNSRVLVGSRVFASCDNGTNTTEGMAINRVTPAAGSVVIRVRNTHAATAWNGTIKINFYVLS